MIKILSVASECAPFVKTGGLADVVGALPAALRAHDCDMRVLLPGYPAVLAALGGQGVPAMETRAFLPGGGEGRILSAKREGIELLVLDAPGLFDREGGIYTGADRRDYPDNPERFAALCRAAAVIAAEGVPRDSGAEVWRPQVLHLHDWQGGLTPVYLRDLGLAGRVGTLLSIHNVAFHGLAPAEKLGALGLSAEDFSPGGFEYYGQIGALKAGIVFSDRVATVSPTYARELMTPEFGMGLDGVLRARPDGVTGILNGIATSLWDPAEDRELVARFSSPRGKARNRRALAAEFGLPAAGDGPFGDGPLCVVISRMTAQKGLDLLLEALPALVERGGRLAVLGAGDAELEDAWQAAARDHPNVAVRIGYDEALSHRMIAGADAIIVPSRFEPCGLTQLYGLRYGAVPVVALTGGLADTIIPANDAAQKAGCATGIQFNPVDLAALRDALMRLGDLYRDGPAWSAMQRNAMRHPVGWDLSAARYAEVYRELAGVE